MIVLTITKIAYYYVYITLTHLIKGIPEPLYSIQRIIGSDYNLAVCQICLYPPN